MTIDINSDSHSIQVRVENIKDPSDHISAVLERVKPEYLSKSYQVSSWTDASDFLELLAKRTGKLLKVAVRKLSHTYVFRGTKLHAQRL